MTGFLLWRVENVDDEGGKKEVEAEITTLKLPSGIRNISTKMNKSNSCVLSAGHVYAVAGIRKELYIWTMKDGMLVMVDLLACSRIFFSGGNSNEFDASIGRAIR